MTGDLAIHEKLDAMIARNIKQLFVVKGLKSVAGLGPSVAVETKPLMTLAAPARATTMPPQVALKK
jgi:hypothetical protein